MKRIGIICAMEAELKDITNVLVQTNTQEVKKEGPYKFTTYTYCGNTIVTAFCSIGKVNAAICTQKLISDFGVETIINPGVAGGMDRAVKVCDVVISDSVAHHDFDLTLHKKYPPFSDFFPANSELIQKATDACTQNDTTSFIGRIVSGEQFISDPEVKSDIKQRLSPLAVDMESSAVAHCAYVNDVPFVIVRCISDNADQEADMSFDDFLVIASAKVAKITLHMLQNM